MQLENFIVWRKTDFEREYQRTEDPWSTKTGLIEHFRLKKLYQMISTGKFNNKRILDIGCGEGVFTQQILKMADVVVGVDISETAVARAKEDVPDGFFKVGDIVSIDFEEKSFDLVLCLEMLYYLSAQERRQVLERIYFLLTDSGCLLLSAPVRGRQYFKMSQLKKLIENSGFKILKCKVISIPFPLQLIPQMIQKWLYTTCLSIANLARYPVYQVGILARKVARS